ncbi:hypothetical protein N7476_005461 [Penicillium atrosanguineum]|uniref:Uncharacterized protein n=1 Tax=Penicillium atrosanguineum TaxID=1132637 RepID=A0A9W9U4H7_9EURO|nr:hypothetical protein N7476_005461 [Penicillium atrosanguineum]
MDYVTRGGQQIEEDPDDFGTQGQRHRVKKEKEERSRRSMSDPVDFIQPLNAYQLILWKQCDALVNDHGFPEEFEAVVRDLWALRLQGFTLRINASADDEDDESEREVFSSQAADTDESDDLGFKARGKYLQWPRMLDTVGLCYLAALLMRLPICVSDFYHLIIRQEIPYIRAVRSVPRDMRDKLPPELISLIDLVHLPKAEQIHTGCRDLVIYYQRRFEIALPPLNSPLILYRHIKRLAIPIDVYDTVKTLQQLIDFNFTYPSVLESQKRRDSLKLPEVQLVVLLVISTKLIFPFDDVKRYTASHREPATQTMDWSRWAYNQKWFEHLSMAQDDKLDKETLIRVNDHDVLQMEPDQLDQYMDWYESSWLDNYRSKHPVADLFSPSRSQPHNQPKSESSDPNEALERVLKSVMVALGRAPVNPSEDADRIRPGSWYRRYRWESQLPETARRFYEIAADLASISLLTLVRAVSVTEWRIAKWLEDERREAYMTKWGMAEVDDGDGTEMDETDEEKSEFEAKEGS